jgi:hypothetical protein
VSPDKPAPPTTTSYIPRRGRLAGLNLRGRFGTPGPGHLQPVIKLLEPVLHPGAASLFLVNAEGWALTCRHVAEQLVQAEQIRQRYQAFKTERDALTEKKRRQLEKDLAQKYSFGRGQVVEIKHRFVGCAYPLKTSL